MAIAGTANHAVVRGAAGSSRNATSRALSTAAITIKTSSPYLRATGQSLLTC